MKAWRLAWALCGPGRWGFMVICSIGQSVCFWRGTLYWNYICTSTCTHICNAHTGKSCLCAKMWAHTCGMHIPYILLIHQIILCNEWLPKGNWNLTKVLEPCSSVSNDQNPTAYGAIVDALSSRFRAGRLSTWDQRFTSPYSHNISSHRKLSGTPDHCGDVHLQLLSSALATVISTRGWTFKVFWQHPAEIRRIWFLLESYISWFVS